MPFRLKNAGTTYHKLVNRMFDDLLRKSMKVYVDDIVSEEFTRWLACQALGIKHFKSNQTQMNGYPEVGLKPV